MSTEQQSSFFDYFKIYGGKTSSFGTGTVCHHRQCCGVELLEPSLPVTAPAPSSWVFIFVSSFFIISTTLENYLLLNKVTLYFSFSVANLNRYRYHRSTKDFFSNLLAKFFFFTFKSNNIGPDSEWNQIKNEKMKRSRNLVIFAPQHWSQG